MLADEARTQRWFPSKVDWWVAGALALGVLVCLGTLGATIAAGQGAAIALWVTVLYACILVGGVIPTRYAVAEDALVIRYGLMRRRIPLEKITEVSATRNAMSAPALSLDRLTVVFGPGFRRRMMISPADKAGFLAALQARTGLLATDDGLIRADVR